MTTETITLRVAGATVTLPSETLTKLWLEQVRQTSLSAEAVPFSPAVPVGELWRTQGGIYAGVARGRKGAPDYYLIVAEIEQASIAWQPAMAWVQALSIDEHRDFALPTRSEQALLYANTKELFAEAWYWSCEQFAGDASSAWCQTFYYGNQLTTSKYYELRARAVRRVPIE